MKQFLILSILFLGLGLASAPAMAQSEYQDADGNIVFVPAATELQIEPVPPTEDWTEDPRYWSLYPPDAPIATPDLQPVTESLQLDLPADPVAPIAVNPTPCQNEVLGVCIDSVIGTGIGGYGTPTPPCTDGWVGVSWAPCAQPTGPVATYNPPPPPTDLCPAWGCDGPEPEPIDYAPVATPNPQPITICSDLAILNPDGTITGGGCTTETWQPPYAPSSESVAQDNQIAPAAPGSIGANDAGSNF